MPPYIKKSNVSFIITKLMLLLNNLIILLSLCYNSKRGDNMEYFDIYDENRKPLNKQKARGLALDDNEYNTGIEVYIINDNKILMTQRCPEKSHAGQWEVPGGCSQAGETMDDTIKREMQEEINVALSEEDYKFITTKMYKHQFVDIYEVVMSIDINNIKLQDEEVSAVKWVDEQSFIQMANNQMIVPSVLERFKECQSLLNIKWKSIN